jgi:hypothetical protein
MASGMLNSVDTKGDADVRTGFSRLFCEVDIGFADCSLGLTYRHGVDRKK